MGSVRGVRSPIERDSRGKRTSMFDSFDDEQLNFDFG